MSSASFQDVRGWRRVIAIVACIITWYSASVTTIFANKHLLTGKDFHFPFFMTAWNNGCVSVLAFILSRHRRFRPPHVSRQTLLRVVLPIGVFTALDIGFSNWSLLLVSISFHTILKGTVPAFVLLFGLLLRLEPRSFLTGVAVLFVCGGISMAALGEADATAITSNASQAPSTAASMNVSAALAAAASFNASVVPLPLAVSAFSFAGLLLGISSAAFSGLRWALLQILIRGHPSEHTREARSCHTSAAADEGQAGSTEGGVAGVGKEATGSEVIGTTQAISRHANPVGSLLYMSPPCAMGALLFALVTERDIIDSPVVHSRQLITELFVLLFVLALLVFILLLAECVLVQLTSSLTLSILGILKEFCTIVLAGLTKGERLTPLKLAGFVTCSSGVFLYHLVKTRKEPKIEKPVIAQTSTCCRPWKKLDEETMSTSTHSASTATRDL